MADLQELVDDLAAEIGRPISVEDRRWRLLAHSAHTGPLDDVRRTTILTREAPAAVQAWLESLGVLRATGLVEVPENPAVGMAAKRACIPVRHGDVLLGFVWVVVGDDPLNDRELAVVARIAGAAEELLWERRTHLDAQQHLLRTLLDDPDTTAVQHAALELSLALRIAERGRVAVAVGGGGEDVGELVRRRWTHGGVIWAPRAGRIVVLADLGSGATPRALADALVGAGAPRAGAGGPVAGVGPARDACADAELALAVLEAEPALGPAVAHDELGGWALVADLWHRAGRPGPPQQVLALTQHRNGDELIAAVEAVLEAGGDVAAAADAIGLHRATLYRRLQRAQEATGLDLARGDDRLLLQLGLRLWRLSQT